MEQLGPALEKISSILDNITPVASSALNKKSSKKFAVNIPASPPVGKIT
jgi:hypothetical protein